MRRPSTAIARSLSGFASLDPLAPDLGRAQLERDHPARRAGHQIHAREARPLLVAREESRRVLGLDPAALDRGADLEQPKVADDPAVVAAETRRPDHSDRVRAD